MRFPLRIVLPAAAVAAFLAAFLWLPQFAVVRAGMSAAILAPGKWASAAGQAMGGTFSGRPAESLERLTAERNAVVLENARLHALEQENQELRELMDVRERSRFSMIAAQVIGKSPDIDTQALILDRGTADGIGPDMAVIAANGYLIGKVAAVTPHTATVVLVTDGRSRVAATVANTDHTVGYVEGGRGLGMALRLIPQYEQVDAGALVMTSGLEEQVPRGLIIGRVERVSREPQEPFQTATVSQIVVPERNQMVAVIKPKGDL